MAHEYILSQMIARLENWATDCEILGEFLELRVQAIKPVPGAVQHFPKTTHVHPRPANPAAYPHSLADAADLLDSVVDLNDDVVTSLGGIVSAPIIAAPPPHIDDNALRLIVHWQAISSGFLKTTIRLYGVEPAPHPQILHPGPKSQGRLIEEIYAWLTKILADAQLFNQRQNIANKAAPYSTQRAAGNRGFQESLLRMEQAYHKLSLDVAQIANVLPSHLITHQV